MKKNVYVTSEIKKTVSVSRYDNICCTTSCSERSLGLSTAKKHNFV